MILIRPSTTICNSDLELESMLKRIEKAGRLCYQSRSSGKTTPSDFITNLIRRGHESPIEHGTISVKIVCDRSISHQIVRHRLVSVSQESQRYCTYKKHVCCIIPSWINIEQGEFNLYDSEGSFIPDLRLGRDKNVIAWAKALAESEIAYRSLLKSGWKAEMARGVLPNSTKTELMLTCNPRNWRHIFKLRCAEDAHPQMREIMIPLLREFQEKLPALFGDLEVY